MIIAGCGRMFARHERDLASLAGETSPRSGGQGRMGALMVMARDEAGDAAVRARTPDIAADHRDPRACKQLASDRSGGDLLPRRPAMAW